MSRNKEIIVVSGLPRSGTSLMMQMLQLGGIEIATDNIREADTDNPRGYLELERVKLLKRDASWVPELRGKAAKLVSQLLYDLPSTETYRVIFMERDLDEILRSQEKMMARRNQPAAPRETMKQAVAVHLGHLHAWLDRQPNFSVLNLSYNDLLANPRPLARRVSQFLGRGEAAEMAKAVDSSLYRNRVAGR